VGRAARRGRVLDRPWRQAFPCGAFRRRHQKSRQESLICKQTVAKQNAGDIRLRWRAGHKRFGKGANLRRIDEMTGSSSAAKGPAGLPRACGRDLRALTGVVPSLGLPGTACGRSDRKGTTLSAFGGDEDGGVGGLDLNFNGREGAEKVTYSDVFRQAEQEYSRDNFEAANTGVLLQHFKYIAR
jgi:hypothetical protein